MPLIESMLASDVDNVGITGDMARRPACEELRHSNWLLRLLPAAMDDQDL